MYWITSRTHNDRSPEILRTVDDPKFRSIPLHNELERSFGLQLTVGACSEPPVSLVAWTLRRLDGEWRFLQPSIRELARKWQLFYLV